MWRNKSWISWVPHWWIVLRLGSNKAVWLERRTLVILVSHRELLSTNWCDTLLSRQVAGIAFVLLLLTWAEIDGYFSWREGGYVLWLRPETEPGQALKLGRSQKKTSCRVWRVQSGLRGTSESITEQVDITIRHRAPHAIFPRFKFVARVFLEKTVFRIMGFKWEGLKRGSSTYWGGPKGRFFFLQTVPSTTAEVEGLIPVISLLLRPLMRLWHNNGFPFAWNKQPKCILFFHFSRKVIFSLFRDEPSKLLDRSRSCRKIKLLSNSSLAPPFSKTT